MSPSVRSLRLITLLLTTQLFTTQLVSTPLLGEEDTFPAATVGEVVQDFSLSDVRGKTWSLAGADDHPIIVIIFMGTECPLMKLYAPRLARMAAQFKDDGVTFVGINSNQQDGLAEIGAYARTHQIAFPILKDPANRVADQFEATRTPEVFVLDAQRQLRYRGSIDDQFHYGIQRHKADHHYVRDAIESLIAGSSIKVEQTEAVGCQIGRILTPGTDSDIRSPASPTSPARRPRCSGWFSRSWSR
jgi:peroxiredoxin